MTATLSALARTGCFFNPSNFGASLVVLLFPRIGIAAPYRFTKNLVGGGSWILLGIIVRSGTFRGVALWAQLRRARRTASEQPAAPIQ